MHTKMYLLFPSLQSLAVVSTRIARWEDTEEVCCRNSIISLSDTLPLLFVSVRIATQKAISGNGELTMKLHVSFLRITI